MENMGFTPYGRVAFDEGIEYVAVNRLQFEYNCGNPHFFDAGLTQGILSRDGCF